MNFIAIDGLPSVYCDNERVRSDLAFLLFINSFRNVDDSLHKSRAKTTINYFVVELIDRS